MLHYFQQGGLGRIKKPTTGGSTGITTWSPTDKTANIILSGGDKIAFENVSTTEQVRATGGVAVGNLVYFEIQLSGPLGHSDAAYGLRESTQALNTANGSQTGLMFRDTGVVYAVGAGNTYVSGWTNFASTTHLAFAVNRVTNRGWVRKDGVWLNSGDPAAGTNHMFTLASSGLYLPAMWCDNVGRGNQAQLKVLSSEWTYGAPSGFGQLP